VVDRHPLAHPDEPVAGLGLAVTAVAVIGDGDLEVVSAAWRS
jgi:hypothetical protein